MINQKVLKKITYTCKKFIIGNNKIASTKINNYVAHFFENISGKDMAYKNVYFIAKFQKTFHKKMAYRLVKALLNEQE